jgi:MFS family permease
VAFIVSFAMVAFLFFVSLYMQNVLGYTPLGMGARLLPTTLILVTLGPIAGRLTDKVGPRPLMTAGLLLVTAALVWESRLTVSSSYPQLLGGFLLFGVGIGLTMSPMSTAAMNAVDRTKAGAASGLLTMSRMVGGTFGIAVLGALVAGIGRSELDRRLPQLAPGEREALSAALGGAGGAGEPGSALPADVVDALHHAFVSAMRTGFAISAAVTVSAALAAWLLIAKRPARTPDEPLEVTPLDGRAAAPVGA